MSEEVTKSGSSSEGEFSGVDRRRGRLPQPDFSVYKKANAYPGTGYFFVGHSFNISATDPAYKEQRMNAISALFSGQEQWLDVRSALENYAFASVLSKFEKDWLGRLPDSALVSPAINAHGHLIPESFTVWRREMRRAQ